MVGQNVGKYRVLDRIGRGGMGTVYRAVDEMLHREVAIKVLNAELNDPEVAKRFRAEAITVARLSHPGIATIYELFEHQGEWLMVMEFVRGETLENMVARMGPLSAQRSAELCMQALAALAHAHSMGVVHRDLKPANLMITENGSVKVMDFGIARVSGSEHLTNAGFMMGTPAYMAPEQVRGGDIDARADIYAMGVVFYRLTTAQLPFKGDTAFAMVQSQVNDPPTPVGLVRTDLPPWVEDIVMRALAKAPEQRFQSAAEFHEAFARSLAGLPLSSMYVGGDAITMLTPSRAMPTGAFNRPMPTPSGQHFAHTSSQQTMASPGTSPGMVSAATDPTMAAPSGATQIPAGSGAHRTAGSAGPPGEVGVRKSIPVLWVGLAAVAVIAGVVGALMFWGGGAAGLVPSPTDIVEATPPPDSASGGGATGTGAATTDAAGQASAAGQGVPSAPQGTVVQSAPAVTPAGQSTRGAGATPGAAAGGALPASPAPTPAGRAAASIGPTPAPGRGTPPNAAAAPGGRTGGAATTGATMPPMESDPLATFTDVKLLEISGKRGTDRDAILNFGGGQLLIMPRSGGAAMATLPYKRISRATYVRARDPKWNTALPSPPEGLDVGSFIRTARHWLVIQGPDHYEILRLEDDNVTRILGAFEARTGIKIDRPKSN